MRGGPTRGRPADQGPAQCGPTRPTIPAQKDGATPGTRSAWLARMACNPAFARGLVGVTALLTAIAGCTSTGSNPGAAGSGAATCNGGCLCFSTSATCPGNCLKTHRTDGSFVCGYSCDAPGVPCNCIYSTADGGIYVCDSFTMPACPANTSGACNPGQPSCMSCGTFAGPEECGCQTSGPFVGDAGPQWQCLGTEQACEGP